MPLKQIDHNSQLYNEMVNLRYEILRKPLGLTFSEEELEHEKNDVLIASLEEDSLLGCCVLSHYEKDSMRLRQMAVKQNLQGKGIGDSIVSFAEKVARDKGYKKIVMHARISAMGFYEKFNYKIKGDEFTEVGLPHFFMEKNLRF